jgi:UDP-galactopyranose mutase
MTYDIVIVGAGLSGSVLADRFARVLNKKVLVIDKRNHIAGNCYDYTNSDGMLMNKYGLHIFHTNDDETYKYITQFGKWIPYVHKVVARVEMDDGIEELVPVPVNIETVNKLLHTHLQTTDDMDAWLKENQVKYPDGIHTSEEMAKSRVGEELYERLFKHYTIKQWNRQPCELDPSVMARIPIRNNHDCRYFSDKYQLYPLNGYTAFVAELLNHPLITLRLNTDYFSVQDEDCIKGRNLLIYTGPIDRYFDSTEYPKLEYRSIRFEELGVQGAGLFQSNIVVNEPSPDVAYTRCVEYSHLPQNRHRNNGSTTIVREYTTDEGEPYYPVPNERNMQLYEKYRQLAMEEERRNRVIFVGRLAQYKYIDMHTAIKNALDIFKQVANRV